VARWRERAEAGGLKWPRKATFHKGEGCEQCLHTGYRGRTGLYEILVLNHELAGLVAGCAESAEVQSAAISAGMTTMFADGMAKVLAHRTSAEEVLRLLPD